jgi:hypothetical protein
MYVRIARFEGGTRSGLETEAENIRRDIEAASRGEASGMPAELGRLIRRALFLTDKDRGSAAFLAFFESEEDLRRADQILDQMSPTNANMGHRVSRDTYEVAFERSDQLTKAA